jgi:aspartate/methionine/tyrosine aminotransferase
MKLAERMSRLGTENAFTVLAQVQKLAATGRDIVSLGIGDPDFDTPVNVREAAKRALDAGRTHYGPSAGIPALRDAIAAYLTRSRGVEFSPDEVVITPGGKPIIFNTIMALAEPGDEVVYPNPGFPIYESVINFAGAKPVPMALVESRDFRLDLDQLRRSVNPRTKLIILNSPNNPTGGVLSRADLEAVAEIAQENDAWILSDEIYSEFLFEGQHASITQIPGLKERTIVLDGFSKTFAMTGWRMGYGAMPAPLAEKIAQMNTNTVSCTATFVQDAGVEALANAWDSVRSMIAEFRARRDMAVAELNRIPGISCVNPQGAFYAFPNITEACRLLGVKNAEEFQHKMLYDGNIAVLARSNFGVRNEGEDQEYIRISFATSMELLSEGLRRIRHVIESAS